MAHSRCLSPLAAGLLLWAASATGSLIVTTTSDAGPGSLRDAILQANATPGLDLIEFALPGPSYIIQPLSALPVITEPVHISGYSQAGSVPNTLADGNNAQILVTLDARLGLPYGLKITAGGSIIEGLAFYGVRFGAAIVLEDRGGNAVYGNRIGTVLTDPGVRNATGILIQNTPDNTIGGPEPFQANRIIGNFGYGISLNGSSGNLIRKNEISGNGFGGIRMAGCDQNQILGNQISGASNGSGITLTHSSGNFIGDGSPENANTVSGNNGDGLAADSTSINNLIAINRIEANKGLGIDLMANLPVGYVYTGYFGSDSKVTANDLPPDADTGGNRLQNFPILERAERGVNDLVALKGTLRSAASTTYRIDVYANEQIDPSGHGQGQAHMATFSVTTNSSGVASFQQLLSPQPGLHISATATDPDNNTSEFCPSVPVRAATITVIPDNPDGPKTLAEAVELANGVDTANGYAVIEFDFPEAPVITELLDELVITRDRVFLNGYGPLGLRLIPLKGDYLTQRGVWLEGAGSSSGTGIRMEGNEGIITGFGFNNFSGAGLSIDGSGAIIFGNSFGGSEGNSAQWGNGTGVEVLGGSGNRIGGDAPLMNNTFDGNDNFGIRIRGIGGSGVSGTSIRGNRIRNTSGPAIGIENADKNRIGGTPLGAANILRNNDGPAIADDGTDTTQVIGNSIQGNAGIPYDIAGEPNMGAPQIDTVTIRSDGRQLSLAGSAATPAGNGTAQATLAAYLVDLDAPEDGGRFIGAAVFTPDGDGQTNLTLEIDIDPVQLRDQSLIRFATVAEDFGSSEYAPAIVADMQAGNPEDLVITFTSDGAEIGFDTRYGSSYTVWKSNSPALVAWEPLATAVAGTGDVIQLTDPEAPDFDASFYMISENLAAGQGQTGKMETVTRMANGDWLAPFEKFLAPTLNAGGDVAFTARSGMLPDQSAALWQLFIRDRNGGLQPVLVAWFSLSGVSEFRTIAQSVLDRTAPYPISDGGLVAGTATFNGIGKNGAAGMSKFVGGSGGYRHIMYDGTPIPKVPADNDLQRVFWEQGSLFSMPVRINSPGDVVFGGAYRIENNFSFAGSGIHNDSGVIVRNGYPIPGYEGEVFRGVGDPVINNTGRILFTGSRVWVNGVVDKNNDGLLVVQTRNAFQVWWAESEPAPGYPVSETKETRFSSADNGGVAFTGLQFNAAGQIAFAAALSDWDPVPGSGSPTVYSQYLRGEGNEAIYLSDAFRQLTLVAAQEQPAAIFDSPSARLNALSKPVLSESGLVAFTASYGPDHVYVTGKGLFVYDSGTGATRRVYKTGDAVTGLPAFGPTNLFQSVNDVRLTNDHNRVAVNDSGAVAFLAGFTEGTAQGLFHADSAGQVVAVAIEGQPFEIPSTGEIKTIAIGGILFQGGGNSSGQPVGFNNRGQIAFALTFTDGDAGIFLYTPAGAGI